jgi:hypothetical protein
MTVWNTYPSTYRQEEVAAILSAVQAGECVSVVGLSGSGKSNLMAFLAHRPDAFPHPNALVDCNRLLEPTPAALFRLTRQALGDDGEAAAELPALEAVITRRLGEAQGSLSVLFDRFDALSQTDAPAIFSSLRALRDAHKYQLTYVTATRRPLAPESELAELFYAHTLWLGPLSEGDARWNVRRYAQRRGLAWGDDVAEQMIDLTWGYPSLLRAVGDAYAGGADLSLAALLEHPVVSKRIDEFWEGDPSETALRDSGLQGQPLLVRGRAPQVMPASPLTAKEHLLLEYLRAHSGEVCEKDDIIQAVWPEDEIYERGVRDDSLAQLVRRLRVKIEPDASNPSFIHTVPGRGYKFAAPEA